ncbi:hypothetical protein FQR65_LT18778 [Abscondita terminalis]|nr:hypothetical protein FQR65_LT18778 [Abscondita terminalis]
MASECQKLKEEYDACFNFWFCEHFLKGDTNDSMCAELFKSYRDCLEKVFKERNIDVKDLHREPVDVRSCDEVGQSSVNA